MRKTKYNVFQPRGFDVSFRLGWVCQNRVQLYVSSLKFEIGLWWSNNSKFIVAEIWNNNRSLLGLFAVIDNYGSSTSPARNWLPILIEVLGPKTSRGVEISLLCAIVFFWVFIKMGRKVYIVGCGMTKVMNSRVDKPLNSYLNYSRIINYIVKSSSPPIGILQEITLHCKKVYIIQLVR